MEETAVRRVWVEEAGGEREARLRFLAERGLRLIMADLDPAGRETLHFYDPREAKTVHLVSPPGGGLAEMAALFFPSASRWLRLLYGVQVGGGAARGGGSGTATASRGEKEKRATRGRRSRREHRLDAVAGGNGSVRQAGWGLLWETRGGRLLRVEECLRGCVPLWMRGCRAGKEVGWAREVLGGDPFLFLSFLLALEDVRGCWLPPSARAARASLVELLRIRAHTAWLSRAAELGARFRLRRGLLALQERAAELERKVGGGNPALMVLVPGGVEAWEPGASGETEKVLEGLRRDWEGLSPCLASLSPPRWAEKRLSRLPRGKREGGRGGKREARGDGPWEGWTAWVGPLARALGGGPDARAEDPALVPLPGWSPSVKAKGKGTLERMVSVRVGEVRDSLVLLEKLLPQAREGPWRASLPRKGSGRGFGRCEGPEGETCCHLVLERGRVVHVAFSSPRELNRSATSCLEGAWLDEAVELLPLLLPG